MSQDGATFFKQAAKLWIKLPSRNLPWRISCATRELLPRERQRRVIERRERKCKSIGRWAEKGRTRGLGQMQIILPTSICKDWGTSQRWYSPDWRVLKADQNGTKRNQLRQLPLIFSCTRTEVLCKLTYEKMTRFCVVNSPTRLKICLPVGYKLN